MIKPTLFFFIVCTSSILTIAQPTGTTRDDRDGKEYKTVKIGKQTWMAENLNYQMPTSWCVDCDVYGELYNYFDALKACPTGWHLPSDLEWNILISELGGYFLAGSRMKEVGTSHWKSPNNDASNESGFSALPHGYRSINGILNFEKKIGVWWSSNTESDPNAWSYRIDNNKNEITRAPSLKLVGVSVRCIKDQDN